ncbi:MAG: hypothetical protein MMC33_002023 [Icmadophila ericetorum]|nr:hypothetical protein [Icmadophila ericetorum]
MARTAEQDLIKVAYGGKQALKEKVAKAIGAHPSLSPLFTDIARYIIELKEQVPSNDAETTGSPAKKRKLEGDDSRGAAILNQNGSAPRVDAPWSNPFTAPDVSFLVPQRKKLNLEIGLQGNEGIRAVNPKTQDSEFYAPWSDIETILCLPVPEKTAAASNFCVFPRFGNGITPPPENAQGYEPMVWTVAEAKAKGKDESSEPSLRDRIITACKDRKVRVLRPDPSEFVSEAQPHLKGEKAYHVKAFKGSKDGFLFFLSHGIAWTFKKPLQFFSFDLIDSISYTSVLQRTFNLNITTRTTTNKNEPLTQEFEFSMIDQADFAGIDAYIKKHGLQDASMAEQRRAKKLNINGVKRGAGVEEVEDAENGETELEKASREAQAQAHVHGADGQGLLLDEEDEEEDENFDPGSEGESEGSGSSDEEDDEDGGEGGEGGYDEDRDEEMGEEEE